MYQQVADVLRLNGALSHHHYSRVYPVAGEGGGGKQFLFKTQACKREQHRRRRCKTNSILNVDRHNTAAFHVARLGAGREKSGTVWHAASPTASAKYVCLFSAPFVINIMTFRIWRGGSNNFFSWLFAPHCFLPLVNARGCHYTFMYQYETFTSCRLNELLLSLFLKIVCLKKKTSFISN